MHTNNSRWGRERPGPSDGGSVGDAARLIPVVARAAELGRGPAWLVGWVRAQRAGLTAAEAVRDPSVIRRLARDLAGLVRPPGLAETVADRV